MLIIPEEIKDLFRENNNRKETQKSFKLKFYNDKIESLYPYETLFPSEDLFPSEQDEAWLVIEDDRIVSESLAITEALSESDNLEFGSCNANKMEIIVADVAEDVTGREFTLSVEIGGYEMALGIYTVESFVRQADRRKRKITAYDRMTWFNTDVSIWFNELSFPMTLKAFRDSLCAYIGINQIEESLPFDSMIINKTIEPEQISGLDVLKAICQINGCFGHVDKTGELKYIKLQQTGLYPSEDLFPAIDLYPAEFGGDGEPVEIIERYKKLTYEDYLVDGITGIVIRQQEGDIGANVGTGENTYAIEGNFLVYGKTPSELLSIASTLLEIISERIYRPSSLECNAMPWIEIGDAIRAITRDDIVETFVMKRITKGCQAMFDQISSTGAKKRKESFGIHQQIIQLEGKSAVIIKNVEEVSVRITDLKKQEESHFQITSSAIEQEVKRATDEEGKLSAKITLEADRITQVVTAEVREWDTGAMIIDLRGYSEPSEAYPANSDLLNKQYLNQSSGVVYKCVFKNGRYIWERIFSAPKTTRELSSRIDQTARDITLEVERAEGEEKKLSSRITLTENTIESQVLSKTNGTSLYSRITQTEKDISLKVSVGDVTSQINLEFDNDREAVIKLKTGHFVVDSDNFKISKEGNLEINGGIIKMGKTYVYTDNKGNVIETGPALKIENGTTRFLGDNFSWRAKNSSMDADGTLTCVNGKFSGMIEAGSGVIAPKYENGILTAGWKITSGHLEGVSHGSSLKSANIVTPSLMVEGDTTSQMVLTAVYNSDGTKELSFHCNTDLKRHSILNVNEIKLIGKSGSARTFSSDVLIDIEERLDYLESLI